MYPLHHIQANSKAFLAFVTTDEIWWRFRDGERRVEGAGMESKVLA